MTFTLIETLCIALFTCGIGFIGGCVAEGKARNDKDDKL